MLADTIAQQAALVRKLPPPVDRTAAFFDDLTASVATAQRYVLDDNVAAAAEHVTLMDPASIEAAIEFARAPHPVCWFEWAEAPRQRVIAATGDPVKPRGRMPRRIGVLIDSSDTGRGFIATLAWEHGEGLAHVCLARIGYDPDRTVTPERMETLYQETVVASATPGSFVWRYRNREASLRAYAQIAARITIDDHPLASLALTPLIGDGRPAAVRAAREYLEANRHDAADESLFVIAVLMLMQTRNGVERRPETYERLNRARAKKGQRPYFSHEVVTMRLGKAASTAQAP